MIAAVFVPGVSLRLAMELYCKMHLVVPTECQKLLLFWRSFQVEQKSTKASFPAMYYHTSSKKKFQKETCDTVSGGVTNDSLRKPTDQSYYATIPTVLHQRSQRPSRQAHAPNGCASRWCLKKMLGEDVRMHNFTPWRRFQMRLPIGKFKRTASVGRV